VIYFVDSFGPPRNYETATSVVMIKVHAKHVGIFTFLQMKKQNNVTEIDDKNIICKLSCTRKQTIKSVPELGALRPSAHPSMKLPHSHSFTFFFWTAFKDYCPACFFWATGFFGRLLRVDLITLVGLKCPYFLTSVLHKRFLRFRWNLVHR